jgi:LPXTG-motif cell wall-anchored protein
VIIPEPVATAGVKKHLPKTATSLPLFGLIGFLSLAAGLVLRLVTRRSLAQA